MLRIGLIAVVLCGGIASGERAPPTPPGKPKPTAQNTPTVYQGTVAIVTHSQLILATKNERRTFIVPATARIVVNKTEATLYDVVPGQFASVASSNSNGQWVANFILASRQY